ncbi:MAG: hypothetical protein J6Y08_04725 [Clostridiales bacterium]|nr:hypothetical protein [Clostridiales bacterium]
MRYLLVVMDPDAVIDLKIGLLVTTICLCVLAVTLIMRFIVKALTKSNDYGDDDLLGMRKGLDETKNIGSELGSDLGVGSSNAMKRFGCTEVTKKLN